MSVPNGLADLFPAIDNEAFTCSLVSPVENWLRNRAKPGDVSAAMVSSRGSISLDKEAGYPILAMFTIKASDGSLGVLAVMPGTLRFKIDVEAGSVLHSGGFDIETEQAFKAGDSVPVLYIAGPVIFSVRATEAKAGSRPAPLVRVFRTGLKLKYLTDWTNAWRIETGH